MNNVTYVVILNWNGWEDTLACLESVFSMTGAPYKVVVCDNASSDGSLEHIVDWAKGQHSIEKPDKPRLNQLCRTQAEPVDYQLLPAAELKTVSDGAAQPLTIIDNGGNLGFAAGNNTGLSFALQQSDMSHIWLLNNDTMVEPDSLQTMQAELQKRGANYVCGSRIMFFDEPSVIQAIGGNSFNHWTGTAGESLGRYLPETTDINLAEYEAKLDYICGASMLVPRGFLEQVGLMEPGYFLYYEEIDWALRGAGRYKNCVALDSVVYHREGSSIGSASYQSGPSLLSEFYMFRNKLRFTWRYNRHAFPVCYVMSWLQALNRARRGRLKNALLIMQVLLGKKSYANP